MSGGSGARVNAGTLHAIHLLHRRAALEAQKQQQDAPDGDYGSASDDDDSAPDDDGSGDCLPFDLEWDQPEPAENATATLAPAPVSTLDAVPPAIDYATMPAGSIVNTVIFSAKSPLLHAQYNQECCDLLEHAFATPGHSLVSDLLLILQAISAQTNFEVTEIVRLQHKALYDMHRQFKESYAIQHTRRVYHGTGNAHAIAAVGFRGATSRRAKFGKGIYTSAGVMPALAYGELTPELTLTFLVVQLHLGPMGLGKQDQVLHICPLYALISARNLTIPPRWTSAATLTAARSPPSPISRETSTAPRTVRLIPTTLTSVTFTSHTSHISFF